MSTARRYGSYAVKKYPAVRKRYRAYAPAVTQLVKDVAYLGTLINSEPKYFTVQDSNNFNYIGKVVPLSVMAQGDGASSRDGNLVLPRYMSINGYVAITSATTGSIPINVRVLIFRYWGEQVSAAPSVAPAEVLETIGTQFAPLSHLNPDVTGSRGDRTRRIEVHKSMNVLLDNVGSKPGEYFSCNIQLNGQGTKRKEHIKFRSSTTEEPVSGGFYALFISDNATSTQVNYHLESKLTFYDN